MRPYHFTLIFGLVFVLTACANLPPPFDQIGQPTRVIMCTPPPCAADETYECGDPSGECPGGCGTICVKVTPDPNATTPPTADPAASRFICPIVVRTPPPEAPTASVSGTASPNDFVDPHVELCADRAEAAVGSTVNVTAQAVDIGLPIYRVSVRPAGAAEFVSLVEVTYDNQVRNLSIDPIGEAFVFSQASGSLNEMSLELLATAPGTLEVRVSATGEIHYGYPGPATWGGGGSEVMVLTAVGP